jgi:hypothetical protein
VLADVADEQDTIVWRQSMQKLVHLFGAGEAGFVHNVQTRVPVRRSFVPGEQPLERAGWDAGLGELLSRARGRGEPLDEVPFALGGIADRRQCRRLTGDDGLQYSRSVGSSRRD